MGSKEKEKVGSSVWTDAEAAMDRAHDLFTPGEMKEISSIPSHKMVSRHVHKPVQVLLPVFVHLLPFAHFFFFNLLTLGEVFH